MKNIFQIIKDNIRLFIGIIVIIFIGLLIATYILGQQTKVVINEKTFNVKIADSEKERQIGLSKTKKINDSEGMLFIFENPDFHTFWMKDMKFPIDLIFIRDDTVVTVIKNANTPENEKELKYYRSTQESDKVLEINAGLSDEYNIKEGSKIKFLNL